MVRKELGRMPTTLGRALVKSQSLQKTQAKRRARQSNMMRHVEDAGAQDLEAKNKLESVMERDALDEFLTTAVMQEQDFSAQRAQVIMVGGAQVVHIEKKQAVQQLEYEHIRIPRRPAWDFNMDADELQRRERESFLEWRRQLAVYEESSNDKTATPFEKNLEVWRQLWRVTERSHVLVQMVDARNPLLYFCQDLISMAKEIDSRKRCVLVINKADFLTKQARRAWAKYFTSQGIDFVFWSAKLENEQLEADQAALAHAEERRKLQSIDTKGTKKSQKSGEGESGDAKPLSKVEVLRKGQNKFAAVTADDEEDEDEDVEEDQDEDVEGVKRDGSKDAEKKADGEEEEDDDELVDDMALQNEEGDEDEDIYADEDEDVDEDQLEDEGEGEGERKSDKRIKPSDVGYDANGQPKLKALGAKPNYNWKRDPTTIVGHADLLAYLQSMADVDYVKSTFEQLKSEGAKEKEAREGRRGNQGGGVGGSIGANAKGEGKAKVVVGMVGFPNVGKSSTINALIGAKKVSVAPTPGHTKHFQTLILGDDMVLCDCPGLVFPTFVHNKATLVVNGVIPIDTLRDYVSPVDVVAQLVSRSQLIQTYGLDIPAWRPLDGHTLLTCHAKMRGFYQNHGQPDQSRSARIILKDFVSGKLLYCQCPPSLSVEEKQAFYRSYAMASQITTVDGVKTSFAQASDLGDAKSSSSSSSLSSSPSITVGGNTNTNGNTKSGSGIRLFIGGKESSYDLPEKNSNISSSSSTTTTSTTTTNNNNPDITSMIASGMEDVQPKEYNKILREKVKAARDQDAKAASNAILSNKKGGKGEDNNNSSSSRIEADGFTIDLDDPNMGVPLAGQVKRGESGDAAAMTAKNSGVIEVAVTRSKIHHAKPEEDDVPVKPRAGGRTVTLDPNQPIGKKKLYRLRKQLAKQGIRIEGDVDVIRNAGAGGSNGFSKFLGAVKPNSKPPAGST